MTFTESETPMREDIEFDAEGVTLRGWFYKPEACPASRRASS